MGLFVNNIPITTDYYIHHLHDNDIGRVFFNNQLVWQKDRPFIINVSGDWESTYWVLNADDSPPFVRVRGTSDHLVSITNMPGPLSFELYGRYESNRYLGGTFYNITCIKWHGYKDTPEEGEKPAYYMISLSEDTWRWLRFMAHRDVERIDDRNRILFSELFPDMSGPFYLDNLRDGWIPRYLLPHSTFIYNGGYDMTAYTNEYRSFLIQIVKGRYPNSQILTDSDGIPDIDCGNYTGSSEYVDGPGMPYVEHFYSAWPYRISQIQLKAKCSNGRSYTSDWVQGLWGDIVMHPDSVPQSFTPPGGFTPNF